MKVISQKDLEELTSKAFQKIRRIKRIYKYIPFEDGLKYLITDRSLKFNSPINFNDPYDCNPMIFDFDIPKIEMEEFITNQSFNEDQRKLILESFNKENIYKSLKYKSSKERISCFSELNNNNLMWSHYGEYHRGLCVGFEFPIKYKDEFVLYPVNYLDKLEVVKLEQDTNQVLYYWLISKAPEWKYEKEIRAVNIKKADYTLFDKQMIKEIVFGFNVTDQQKERVIKKLKDLDYPESLEINEVEINRQNLKLDIKKSVLNKT